jgi:preprotein translocase subunit YajC
MNWTVIIIVGVLTIGLIVFTIVRNQKDEKEFEQGLNNDGNKINENRDIEVEEKEV